MCICGFTNVMNQNNVNLREWLSFYGYEKRSISHELWWTRCPTSFSLIRFVFPLIILGVAEWLTFLFQELYALLPACCWHKVQLFIFIHVKKKKTMWSLLPNISLSHGQCMYFLMCLILFIAWNITLAYICLPNALASTLLTRISFAYQLKYW